MKALAAKSPSNDTSTKSAGVKHRHTPGSKSVPFFTGTNTFIQTKSICPCDGGCPRCQGVIQSKLNIGQPNDKYEQEADRVADRIMRMPEPEGSMVNGHLSLGKKEKKISPLVQRKTECSGCMEEEEEGPVQLKSSTDKSPPMTAGLQIQIQSLKGGGQPLPESTRTFFEPHFGQDFSQVRVHTDAKASAVAKKVNAQAFTTGKNVVFNVGQFSPDTSTGKRLLAHELSHVVQQSTHGLMSIQRKLSSGDKCEERGPARRENDEDNPSSELPPLIYSELKVPNWISVKKRSKRPAVGYAQRLLNKFLVMYDNKKSGIGTEHIECVGDKKNLDEIDSIRKSLNPFFLEEDCWFGNDTDKAAIMFQLCKGLNADGKIGENTWPRLENLKIIPSKPVPPKKKKPPTPPSGPTCPRRTGITEWGCYCGEDDSCTSGFTCTPLDDLDACCRAHDICCHRCGCEFGDSKWVFSPNFEAALNCDLIFCRCMRRLTLTGRAESYRDSALGIFCPPPFPF